MNKIFEKLIKSKIEKFISDYNSLSREVFVDENGALIHPGEFGVYREKIFRKLLEPFLPTRLAIGSGFIITSKNNISTQCDLIIYDKEHTPIIENEEQRFFPIESVVGVVEVKSVLSKTELKNVLIKLSKIKALRDDIKKSNCYEYKDGLDDLRFDTNLNIRDQIATFLVCEKVNMNIDKEIDKFFSDTYKGIDKKLYHNMILSLENGCFLYYDSENEKPIYHAYFNCTNPPFKNELIMPHELGYSKEHVLLFINYFFMLISSISVLYVEITDYLGVSRVKKVLIEK